MLRRGREGPGPGFDRRLIAPMVLGAVLNPVNSSMIAVALIPIGAAFGAPPADTAWLVSGLYLATAIGQPVVGRLVDAFGPRRLFLAGAVLTGVAGVLGVVAPNLGVLVGARVLLGFGTCAGNPAAMALIRGEDERTGSIGGSGVAGVLTVLSVAAQTVSVVGPALGGLLIGAGGWRWIFAVNVPLALAALVLGALHLPRTLPPGPRPSFDAPGVALFAVTLTSLLLVLMTPAWWPLLAVTAAAGALFVRREVRHPEPFLDLRVLRTGLALPATFARTLLTSTVAYTFLFGYTQWVQETRGLSPTGTGLVVLPTFVVAIAVSAATGRSPRIRGKLVVGAIVLVAACVLLLALGATSPIWLLVLLAVLVGVPQGLLNLANQTALYHQSDPARTGSSAGLMRTFFYLGAMVSAAVIGVFFADGPGTPGLHGLAWFGAGVACLLLVLVVADRSLRRIGDDAA